MTSGPTARPHRIVLDARSRAEDARRRAEWASRAAAAVERERAAVVAALEQWRANLAVPRCPPRTLSYFDPDFVLGCDRGSLLDAFLDAAMKLAHAERGNVQLTDPATGRLRIAAQHGFEPEFLDFFAVVRLDESTACGAALAQARAVQVQDVARSTVFGDGPVREVVLEAGVRSVTSMPLVDAGGALLGVFSVHYGRPRMPLTAERNILATLAASAARRLSRSTGR